LGDEGELFLNGKSLGKRKKNKFEYRLQWDDVIYQARELKVKVWKAGKEWEEDSVITTSDPIKIVLLADRKEIISNADDLVFVTIYIVDKNNLLVPRVGNMIEFELDLVSEFSFVCPNLKLEHYENSFEVVVNLILRHSKSFPLYLPLSNHQNSFVRMFLLYIEY